MSTVDTSTRGALLGRPFTSALLVLGPYLTMLLALQYVDSPWLRGDQLSVVLLVVLLAWSPVLGGIPAFLLQDARDAALPRMQSLSASALRSLLLVPYLLFSEKSTVRVEMWANMLGLFLGSVLAWGHLAS